MKKSTLILLLIVCSIVCRATDYYVSPSGNDATGAGTFASPWKTLNKVWTVLTGSDDVYLRGGTYALNDQQYLDGVNGTSGNMVKVWAYQDEVPIITKGSPYSYGYHRGGCYFEGNWFHWKGIEITGFTQETGAVWNGFLAMNSDNNIFEEIVHHGNGGGFYIEGSSDNNLILNCDSYDNYDPITDGGNADGFDAAYNSGTSGTTTFRGCRSWHNSDDGFDTWDNHGLVVFDSCWSWHNGYIPGTSTPAGNGQGFKLANGGSYPSTTKRILQNCLAYDNLTAGYSQETENIKIEQYNSIAYDNNAHGWWYSNNSANSIIKNCVAYSNTSNQAILGTNTTSTTCSASGTGDKDNWTNDVSDADFASITSSTLDDARQSNGTLPGISFLHLASGSSLIDAGTDVSLSGWTNPPDRGAFQYAVAGPVSTNFTLRRKKYRITR